MTYVTEKIKTTQRPILLAEIQLGTEYGKWTNEGPGIWKSTLYISKPNASYGFKQAFLIGPFKESGTGDLRNETFTIPIDVVDVEEDGTSLTEAADYATMYSTAARWYWEKANQRLYVHMTNSDWIHEHIMTVDVELNLTNDTLANSLGQGYYEERLLNVSSLSKTKDSHAFGLIQAGGGTIEANNADGALDYIMGMDYFGQQFTLKYGFPALTYGAYIELVKSYIEDAEFAWDTVKFSMRDDRKKLARKIPTNVFNQTDYPSLDDGDVGKSIPLVWGICYRIPCVCVNQAAAGPWQFRWCDTTDHTDGISTVTAAYVDGVSTAISTRYASGLFVIATANYTAGQDVTADVKGFLDGANLMEAPLDVIADIMSVYMSIEYTATNYDTTEWVAASAETTMNNVGLFVEEPTEVIECINMICNSVGGNFIKKDSGLYTFRVTDVDAASSNTITVDDYMSPIVVRPDAESLATVFRIGYHKDWAEDKFAWLVENSDRAAIFARYSKDNEIEIETLLTTNADAQTLATYLYALYDEAEPILDLELWWRYMDLEIMDVLTVPVKRVTDAVMMPSYVGEVVDLSKDPMTGRISLKVRRLRGA